jgi:tetratricopeptide (TPR) repeat protein
LFVEDVITAITGGMGGVPLRSLRSNMERAAVEFDERTAEAFARALFTELSQNPHDVRGLESLIVLGLAHPRILARHGISLETEGRRLAVVLDRSGQSARAQQLLEMLATNMPVPGKEPEAQEQIDESTAARVAAIDTLLRQADHCIARGRKAEGIKHLQEILRLDHDRFDVARMIRDLRRGQEGRRANYATFAKVVLSMLVVGALGYGLVTREQRVRARWDALPQAGPNDTAAMQVRLSAIKGMLAEEHVWGGMFQAWRERDELDSKIQRHQEEVARAARAAALEKQGRLQEAEDLRERAMRSVKSSRFDEALVDLRQALELGGEHWEKRARVQADISAIEGWKAEKP